MFLVSYYVYDTEADANWRRDDNLYRLNPDFNLDISYLFDVGVHMVTRARHELPQSAIQQCEPRRIDKLFSLDIVAFLYRNRHRILSSSGLGGVAARGHRLHKKS